MITNDTYVRTSVRSFVRSFGIFFFCSTSFLHFIRPLLPPSLHHSRPTFLPSIITSSIQFPFPFSLLPPYPHPHHISPPHSPPSPVVVVSLLIVIIVFYSSTASTGSVRWFPVSKSKKQEENK